MTKKRKTYKDFEIGQSVICILNDTERLPHDFLEQHLTVGKLYIVEDTDFHFPDSIVVQSDNGKISMFFPVECFETDINIIRKKKYKRLKIR
jgi:hypothetical protein